MLGRTGWGGEGTMGTLDEIFDLGVLKCADEADRVRACSGVRVDDDGDRGGDVVDVE